MSDTANIRFGINNQMPNMTLSSSPVSDTPIDWLKNEYGARQVVWDDAAAEIVITGTLPELQWAEFFAMAGSNLIGTAETTLTLYNDGATQASQTYDSGTVTLADMPPLGEWRAGIDAYGVPRSLDNPQVFVLWFDQPYQYDSFELRIQNPAVLPAEIIDIRIRMLMLGEKLELAKNFSYGNSITFLTDPDLVRVASGRFLPSRIQQKSRIMSMNLNHMTDQDRSQLWQMEVTLNNEAFLVSAYPDSTGWQFINHNFLARFANALNYTHQYHGGHGVDNMTIVEV